MSDLNIAMENLASEPNVSERSVMSRLKSNLDTSYSFYRQLKDISNGSELLQYSSMFHLCFALALCAVLEVYDGTRLEVSESITSQTYPDVSSNVHKFLEAFVNHDYGYIREVYDYLKGKELYMSSIVDDKWRTI